VSGSNQVVSSVQSLWITGGYIATWINEVPARLRGKFLIVQDVLPNALTEAADVLLPGAMWAEKDGTWENHQGTLQVFAKAIEPPGYARREGDVYDKLLGGAGKYDAAAIRAKLGEPFAALQLPLPPEKVEEPAMEFAEL
jgi:anaerobic selenocysteine-containing dehydrogenase